VSVCVLGMNQRDRQATRHGGSTTDSYKQHINYHRNTYIYYIHDNTEELSYQNKVTINKRKIKRKKKWRRSDPHVTVCQEAVVFVSSLSPKPAIKHVIIQVVHNNEE